ncbi:MAG: efflux RND transporter periplasmic adaptor subunit [Prevotellaceae bacterium]|nr:efflux RND transporter periplasmic adaptor subunit [Prevotellaceae bacterium]
MTTQAKTIATIAAIGLAGALVFFILHENKKDIPVTFETAKAERATIGNSVTATGTIEPVTKVEVGTQVSGIIDRIYVDYNSVVKRGQVIAELDKTNLISELNTARNALATAQSELDYRRLDFSRQETLCQKGLIAANVLDQARVALNQATNTVASCRENVKKAETNLGYATITSPIDGVILTKEVEEGQTVAATMTTPTLFTIAKDLTDMRVIADVDEADIGNVAEGQRVTFTVDAYPDDTFEGRVTQVRQNATTESNVVTYEVVISAPNDDLKLKPGLTANVNIFTLERTGILSVPTKALRFTPTKDMLQSGEKIIDSNAKNKVWVRKGHDLVALSVRTGITNGSRTEIIDGLAEGTEVILDINADKPENDETAMEKSPFAPGPRGNKNGKK